MIFPLSIQAGEAGPSGVQPWELLDAAGGIIAIFGHYANAMHALSLLNPAHKLMMDCHYDRLAGKTPDQYFPHLGKFFEDVSTVAMLAVDNIIAAKNRDV